MKETTTNKIINITQKIFITLFVIMVIYISGSLAYAFVHEVGRIFRESGIMAVLGMIFCVLIYLASVALLSFLFHYAIKENIKENKKREAKQID